MSVSFERLKAFIQEAMVRLGLPEDHATTVATLMGALIGAGLMIAAVALLADLIVRSRSE